MSKKLTAVAAALVFVAAACGGNSGASSDQSSAAAKPLDHKVTVTFWHAMSSGTQAKGIKQAADDFNASQNLVTVQLVDQSSYGALQQKLLANLAAGTPPDGSQCYENWAAKFNDSRSLAEITPYINASDGLTKDDLNDFWPIMLQDGKLKGKQYMMPFNKSDIVMYYNTDLLQQAGVDPPRTWEELKNIAPKLRKGSDRWAIDFTSALTTENIFAATLPSYGGSLFDKDLKKPTFNQKPGQEILQLWSDLVRAGDAHIATGPDNSFPDQNDFTSQHTAIYISSIASYNFLGNKFKWAVAPMLGGPKGQHTEMFGTNACIYAKAPADHQQGVFQFIKYFTSRKGTANWASTTGYMPVRQSAYKDLIPTLYTEKPGLKVAVEQLPNAIVEPPLTIWSDQNLTLNTEINNALTGKKTPKQALDDAAKSVNDALAAA